jgi:hypothetical protein
MHSEPPTPFTPLGCHLHTGRLAKKVICTHNYPQRCLHDAQARASLLLLLLLLVAACLQSRP